VERVDRLLAGLGVGIGLCLVGVGLAPSVGFALPLYAGMGLAVGVAFVQAITWLQRRAAPGMQGRMSSLLTFAAVAADPFSNALAGAIADVSLAGLFVGAGLLTIAIAAAVLRARSRDPTTRYPSPGEAAAPSIPVRTTRAAPSPDRSAIDQGATL
jgi:MFS family permease